MDRSQPILIYTDGACSGNPGKGGYGAILKCGSLYKEISEGYALTTNNRMELLSVIEALEMIKWDNASVTIWSDSSYVVNAVEKGWLFNWEKKLFNGKANEDLWVRFLKVYRRHKVKFVWIKGHAGHPENERCDELAVTAYKQPRLKEDIGYIRSNGNGEKIFE